MDTALLVDQSRLRRWHVDLAVRLSGRGAPALLATADGAPLPSSVDLILSLEQLVRRLPGPRPSDRVEPLETAADPRPGRVLDLSVAGSGGPGALRLLYDGVPDEAALFGALLAGRTPLLEIAEAGSARVLGRALPSTETAESLHEAYESVVARAATLAVAVLSRAMAGPDPGPVAPASAGAAAVARYAGRNLAYAAVRWLYRLCTRAPHWRIGWRFVDGPDVYDRQGLGGPAWRDVPDPGLRFLADPFPAVWRGETWLLAEDFDHRTRKGIISAIPFGPNGPSGPPRPVLETPWHLSYPFLIEEGGEIWMVPESSADSSVRLYRADPFPTRWVEEAVLLDGIELSDATIHRQDGRFWMFGTTRDGGGAPSDTLSLFMADALAGPWRPHPANPILIDASAARPAGGLVRRGGRLWRPVQDCRGGYGRAVGLAEVTRLDEEGFSQIVRAVVRPGPEWPGRRLHTLNRAGRLECIDGSAVSSRGPIPSGRIRAF
ncbi:glucosamine inositolphosphorylceramide transferase family protein [Methylobacterium nigriterrae]|uniref:glucosamine inositolphosphorylceramide transferase family protein n=1 Tax=Methylobacterium nigriterrae TaxID=3127512 RepID=UPI0030141217